MTKKLKILFLSANPQDKQPLFLDEEFRAIQQRIRGAGQEDRFDVVSEWALRPQELPAAVMRHKPNIVHFSGHGNSSGQLDMVNDTTGGTQTVSPDTLGEIFKLLGQDVSCVVLNACYSALHAQAIAASVPCVVGMSSEVTDESAIAFAAGFYEALVFGQAVQTAFELGRQQLALSQQEGQKEIPQLLVRGDIDPHKLTLLRPLAAAPAPEADWTSLLQAPAIYDDLARSRSLFSGVSDQIALLTWYKTLHDDFQELESPYKVLLSNRKLLGTSRESWDAQYEYLASTQEWIGLLQQHLERAPILGEFAMCRQQLADAGQGLAAALSEANPQLLKRALMSIHNCLGRDPAKANKCLVGLAQNLPLKIVVQKLQSAHRSLSQSAPGSRELLLMGQQIEALDTLERKLVTLVEEHNRWQDIDNELRAIVDGAAGTDLDLIESQWRAAQSSVADLLRTLGPPPVWAAGLGQIGAKIDAALGSQGAPEAQRTHDVQRFIGDYFRTATRRFMDVDKMLLKTCEALEQQRTWLDSLHGVLHAKP